MTKTPTLIAILTALTATSAQAQFQARIIGGNIVSPGDQIAANTIAVAEIDRQNTTYICTGSIIAQDLIVTAGHCVGPTDHAIQLVFGTDVKAYFVDENPEALKQAVNVTAFRRHPGYKYGMSTPKNDIALLYYKEGVPAPYHPIQILPSDVHLQAGQSVIEAGFGLTVGGSAVNHSEALGVLRATEVTINSFYQNLEIKLNENQGHSSCEGDSGGPLLVQMKGENYLLGATSRGDADCGGIGIDTNILGYLDWIREAAREMRAE